MASDDDLYGLYTRVFGKVKSGTKLTNRDYAHHEQEKAAVTMAAGDCASGAPLRVKSKFLEELKRRLS